VGWDEKAELSKHPSQNASRGFGGKFGVETDKQDKSAVGWTEPGALSVHESQASKFYHS
jgi:cortactin